MAQRVVVTGVGVASALGCDVPTFWRRLCAGESGVTALPDISAETGHPAVGGRVADLPEWPRTKSNRRAPDRMIQLAHWSVEQALRDAGGTLPDQTALIWGTGYTAIASIEASYEAWYCHNRLRADTVPACMPTAVIAHLTMTFGLHGWSNLVSASCTSGLSAIGLAYHLLRGGVVPAVVVGAADAPLTAGMFRAWRPLRVLASDVDDAARACRPFSVDRSGLVLAEGGAALLLETLDQARERGATIYAEVLGFAGSSSAVSILAPDVATQAAVVQQALDAAGVAAAQVGYVNAHATGTRVGDSAEAATIRAVWGDDATLPVSSIKGATGHAMGASSALETVVTVLALQHQTLPPTINWTAGDAECNLDVIPAVARPHSSAIALKQSFGFGGANAALLLRRWSDGHQAIGDGR